MRSKNAIRNLVIYLIYEIIVLILGFIFPRLIILNYGSAINGLTSTITRILALINLVQAGAVGAAIYQMYKPVAEEDYETQSAIIYSSKRFYNKITIIYFVVAIIVGCFYGFYLKDDSLSFIEIFIPFTILAVNGASSLLFNSICDIFVSPHQKRYFLTVSLIANQLTKYGLIALVIIFKLHFIFIYVSYLLGGLVGVILDVIFYRILSRGKISKNPLNKNYRIPDRKYLMFSSIGSEIVNAAPAVIITTFIGLEYASVFSVYSLIFTSLMTILNSIQLSFSAIFGNLVKTSNDEKIYRVYSTIELMIFIIGSFFATCVGFLIMPFISLYTSGVEDVNYYYPVLGVFVTCYIMFFTLRTSYGYVLTVYGLFKQTCFITLIFGGVGILISIVCAIFFGLPFVMVGILFSQLGYAISSMIIAKKSIVWFKVKRTLLRALAMTVLTAFSVVTFFIANPSPSSWLQWIAYGAITSILSLLIIGIYCLLCERKQMKNAFSYVKNVFKRNKI